MTIRSFGLSALAIAVLLAGCTVPPPLQKEEAASVIADVLSVKPCPLTAWGEMVVSKNGASFNCAIETRSSGSGDLSVNFFGPFGITLASLQASHGNGVIRYQGKERRFDSAMTIDDLLQVPASSGRFTFTQLEPLIEGMVPEVWSDPLKRKPDSIINDHSTISALWKTDSIQLQAQIRKKQPQTENLELVFDSGEQVNLGSIKNGRAHKIELRESDGSYILVNYSTIKCKAEKPDTGK